MYDYDVVSGFFVFIGEICLIWSDIFFQWNFEDFGNVIVIRFLVDEVWILNIGIGNLVESEEFMEIEIVGFFVVVLSKGVVYFRNLGLIKIMCEFDVMYYLFDIYNCLLILNVLNYDVDEIQFNFYKQVIESSIFKDNGQWKVVVFGLRIEKILMIVDL